MKVIFREEPDYYNLCEVETLPYGVKLQEVVPKQTIYDTILGAMKIKKLFYSNYNMNEIQSGIVIEFLEMKVRVYQAKFSLEDLDTMYADATNGTSGTLLDIMKSMSQQIAGVENKKVSCLRKAAERG